MITKLDDVEKVVEPDVPVILQEQLNDPVLRVVRSWIQGGVFLDLKTPDIRQSKCLLQYCQERDRLLIEKHGQLLCYNELSDTLYEEYLQNRLPLPHVLACFRMGHYKECKAHGSVNDVC